MTLPPRSRAGNPRTPSVVALLPLQSSPTPPVVSDWSDPLTGLHLVHQHQP